MLCSKCGSEMGASEGVCGQCGSTPSTVPAGSSGDLTVINERRWAMGAHLSGLAGGLFPGLNIVAPVVIWQMKKDSPYIAQAAMEAANFQIAVTAYLIVAGLSMFVLIGFLLTPLLGLAAFVLMILAAVKANNGEQYTYPYIFRVIK